MIHSSLAKDNLKIQAIQAVGGATMTTAAGILQRRLGHIESNLARVEGFLRQASDEYLRLKEVQCHLQEALARLRGQSNTRDRRKSKTAGDAGQLVPPRGRGDGRDMPPESFLG
jgi:hypothetical protein